LLVQAVSVVWQKNFTYKRSPFLQQEKRSRVYCQLSISVRQSLLHITLSAAPFLHAQLFFIAVSVNHNYFVCISLLGI
jgi:hypothetical protein